MYPTYPTLENVYLHPNYPIYPNYLIYLNYSIYPNYPIYPNYLIYLNYPFTLITPYFTLPNFTDVLMYLVSAVEQTYFKIQATKPGLIDILSTF